MTAVDKVLRGCMQIAVDEVQKGVNRQLWLRC